MSMISARGWQTHSDVVMMMMTMMMTAPVCLVFVLLQHWKAQGKPVSEDFNLFFFCPEVNE